jgi:hypothetical protein
MFDAAGVAPHRDYPAGRRQPLPLFADPSWDPGASSTGGCGTASSARCSSALEVLRGRGNDYLFDLDNDEASAPTRRSASRAPGGDARRLGSVGRNDARHPGRRARVAGVREAQMPRATTKNRDNNGRTAIAGGFPGKRVALMPLSDNARMIIHLIERHLRSSSATSTGCAASTRGKDRKYGAVVGVLQTVLQTLRAGRHTSASRPIT